MLTSIAALMVFALGARPMQAQDPSTQGSLGSHSGTRGGGGPVQAVVKLNGAPVAGVTVTFTATKSVTATTDANGVASINLIAGHYTVTASNASGTATKKIVVVDSTTPVIVGLSLAPATP